MSGCKRLPALAFIVAFGCATCCCFSCCEAVLYQVTNNAAGTAGGNRFDSSIGVEYTIQVLDEASSFIWDIFNQTSDSSRKSVQQVSVQIVEMDGAANTAGDVISISAQYIQNFNKDLQREIKGMLYHEMTHVWQWNGQGSAPGGLVEGVADYVRLKKELEPEDGHWVKRGGGNEWNQGYDVTARFLDYCNDLNPGFVGMLNALMKDGYSDAFFMDLLGKPVDQLFTEYKAAFPN